MEPNGNMKELVSYYVENYSTEEILIMLDTSIEDVLEFILNTGFVRPVHVPCDLGILGVEDVDTIFMEE